MPTQASAVAPPATRNTAPSVREKPPRTAGASSTSAAAATASADVRPHPGRSSAPRSTGVLSSQALAAGGLKTGPRRRARPSASRATASATSHGIADRTSVHEPTQVSSARRRRVSTTLPPIAPIITTQKSAM